jgi:hypothetical protein
LVLVALSAAKIILYNEEILVAIAFVLFLVAARKQFGSSIAEMFEERAQGIATECQRVLEDRTKMATLAHEAYKNRESLVTLASLAGSLESKIRASARFRAKTSLVQAVEASWHGPQSAWLESLRADVVQKQRQQTMTLAARPILENKFRSAASGPNLFDAAYVKGIIAQTKK